MGCKDGARAKAFAQQVRVELLNLWTAEELQKVAPEFDADAVELLSARRSLENHVSPGGTAPQAVAAALADAQRRLDEMRKPS